MAKELMSGNEAVARGAYEAGVSFASAYPGTPSTEILENIGEKYSDRIICEWAPNEKVAFEAAVGASIIGGRSMAAMKHVGLNVAADPMCTFAYTGVNGGMFFVSADDPGMHSSQNEQDNRYYARFAKIAMLEPSDSQECKDMVKTALEISERFDTPVMLRMTTRVCHSKSLVEFGEPAEQVKREYVKDRTKFDPVPAMAKLMHTMVEKRWKALGEFADECPLTREIWNGGDIGIISSGAAFNYAVEVFGDKASYLKLGFTCPLPMGKIKEFAKKVKKLYVVEELEPYMEDQLRAAGIECVGKALIPEEGELNPDIIRAALTGEETPTIQYDKSVVAGRPPMLCAGCPHVGLFYELGKIKDVVAVGDIGCYALSGNPPLNAKDFALCMGAGFSMAHGAAKITDKFGAAHKIVAVMGDSTFFHSGMTSLLDAVYNNSNAVFIIVDNRITGMTGHQENPGSGFTITGAPAPEADIEGIARSFGMKDIHKVNPMDLAAVREALNASLAFEGPSLIITRYPCVLKKWSQEDKDEFAPDRTPYSVDHDKCIGCRSCIRVGCPALSYDKNAKKASVDPRACAGCGVCAQVCPKKAISRKAGE
jgi:indolepyruvate ferredoxin oxidoreductase alpha subunit